MRWEQQSWRNIVHGLTGTKPTAANEQLVGTKVTTQLRAVDSPFLSPFLGLELSPHSWGSGKRRHGPKRSPHHFSWLSLAAKPSSWLSCQEEERARWSPAPKHRILHYFPFVPAGNKCNVQVSVCSIKTQTLSQNELFLPHAIDIVTRPASEQHSAVCACCGLPVFLICRQPSTAHGTIRGGAAASLSSVSHFYASTSSLARARRQSTNIAAGDSNRYVSFKMRGELFQTFHIGSWT